MTLRLSRSILHLVLLATLLVTGCRSANRIMARSPNAVLEKRLPSLQLEVDPGPMAATDGALPEDPQKIFDTEMHHNIMEPADSTEAFGYAKLQIHDATISRGGKGFQAFQMMTLLTPSLLGMPLEYCRTHVEAELQLIDAHGNVIGTYTGTGSSNVRVAMYYGYSQSQAPRLADVEALRQALGQIRPQLESDVDSLRQKLLRAGLVHPQEIVGAAY